MRKKELRRLPYVAPTCKVLLMEVEDFIATSVFPKVPGSKEDEWTEHEEDGGELEL